MKPFSIVAALDADLGIGKNGTMPWYLPGDFKHFKELTLLTHAPSKKNAVIMGRKTWESIPEKFRPLAGRVNVVITRTSTISFPDGVIRVDSIDDALGALSEPPFGDAIESVFVIGGARVYTDALQHSLCRTLFLTHICGQFNCDAFFPRFGGAFSLVTESSRYQDQAIEYYFSEYQRKK